MYAFISGTLADKHSDSVVVEAGGIGYHIFVSTSTLSILSPQQKLKLYTYLVVREDAMILFGFMDMQEKAMFERLITVSGIGPKIAMAVLSAFTPQQLAIAIVTGDEKALGRISGIGKKTAQRILLELKEKVSSEELIPDSLRQVAQAGANSAEREAVEALIALGYGASEAGSAIAKVAGKADTVEDLITLALKASRK